MYAIETIQAALQTSYDWVTDLGREVSDAPMTPTPGGGQHPLWIMGHLAYSRGDMLGMINGQPNPLKRWRRLFAAGVQPSTNRGAYPGYSEVLAANERTQQATMALLAEIRGTPAFGTSGRIFLSIAAHDMSHRNQLAQVRCVLKSKQVACPRRFDQDIPNAPKFLAGLCR